MSFFSDNITFVIALIAIACVLLGRVWSNFLNWGEITDPQALIRQGKEYKLVNLYLPKGWTEGWEVGSIVCLESVERRMFRKGQREIYISGDKIRFTDDGPTIGAVYKASFTHASSGSIVMTHIVKPGVSKQSSKIDWARLK